MVFLWFRYGFPPETKPCFQNIPVATKGLLERAADLISPGTRLVEGEASDLVLMDPKWDLYERLYGYGSKPCTPGEHPKNEYNSLYWDVHLPNFDGLHISGWWFGTFFIFPYIDYNHPN